MSVDPTRTDKQLADLLVHALGRYDDAHLLRTLRGNRSQQALAAISGVSRNVIASVESGRQRLAVRQLVAIAGAVSASTSDREKQ